MHGVNETGKDDPRIVWVADLLARAGFLVLTPDFTGFKSLTLRASDLDEIAASARFLGARMPGGGPERVGLVAFSYGAGPAVVAAAKLAWKRVVRPEERAPLISVMAPSGNPGSSPCKSFGVNGHTEETGGFLRARSMSFRAGNDI